MPLLDLDAYSLAVACAVLGVAAVILFSRVRSLKAELAVARAAVAKPRVVEGRQERFGLLWFPQLTVDDRARQVTAAAAGRPYCPKDLALMALQKGPPEEWACPACADRRAGTAADLQVMDQVVAQAVREFTVRAGYSAAPSLPKLKG